MTIFENKINGKLEMGHHGKHQCCCGTAIFVNLILFHKNKYFLLQN